MYLNKCLYVISLTYIVQCKITDKKRNDKIFFDIFKTTIINHHYFPSNGGPLGLVAEIDLADQEYR